MTGETRGVLAARLSPVPAEPVSYGAGFARVSPRSFAVGTFIGEIPWVAVEVTAGASLRSLTLTGLTIDALPHVTQYSAALAVLVLAELGLSPRQRSELVVNSNRAPPLSLSVTDTDHPWACATSATIARPNPVPASLVV